MTNLAHGLLTGAKRSVRLLLTKNPTRSFILHPDPRLHDSSLAYFKEVGVLFWSYAVISSLAQARLAGHGPECSGAEGGAGRSSLQVTYS